MLLFFLGSYRKPSLTFIIFIISVSDFYVQLVLWAGGLERLKSASLLEPVVLEVQDIIRKHLEETWMPLFLSTEEFTERQTHKQKVVGLIPHVSAANACIYCSCRKVDMFLVLCPVLQSFIDPPLPASVSVATSTLGLILMIR